MIDILEEVKTRLLIADDYHDDMLEALIEDVKAYMLSGGVDDNVVESDKAVGCIARGVADLYDFGSGNGRFSEVFNQRVFQLTGETNE